MKTKVAFSSPGVPGGSQEHLLQARMIGLCPSWDNFLIRTSPLPLMPLYCFYLPFPCWLRLTFNKRHFCAELLMTYCRVSSSPGQATSPAPGRTAACKGKLHFDLHSPFLFSVTWLWRQKEENNVFSPTPHHPCLPLDYVCVSFAPFLSFFPIPS